METQLALEKWPGTVSTVTIGATPSDGGTRSHTINVGGQNAMPLMFKDGAIPNPPVVAFEVWDVPPVDFEDEVLSAFGQAIKDPFAWADICVNKFNAQMLCLKMQGAHPDFGNKSALDSAKFVSQILSKVKVPLIIVGCGDEAKDNQILPACSEAAKKERCLIGSATQDNYKTLTASVLADGHGIIAESPIDINIAKQLNILISDMGLGLERIVIDPTIGALGYGLEYAYSIMERARLAALSGDKTVASPFICFVGQEAWRAKEAKALPEQGIAWETLTASNLIQSGADILVMRHPKAFANVSKYIDELFIK